MPFPVRKRAGRTLWFCFFTALIVPGVRSLDWSLGFFSDNPGVRGVSFSRPLPLQNGDEFTLYVKSESPAYCYVIARDSENSLHVLNNSALGKDEELTVGPLELTPPSGQELFYVIMSGAPQKTLEDHIRLFETGGNSPRASDNLIGEVLRIRRSVSQLRERPEMPLSMGGSFRGEGISGIRYSGTECYVKTIVIRH
jgi:hypothetical protein